MNQLVNESINHKGVYRAAPATRGLLVIEDIIERECAVFWNNIHKFLMNYCA